MGIEEEVHNKGIGNIKKKIEVPKSWERDAHPFTGDI
jgi:hypothetical protein